MGGIVPASEHHQNPAPVIEPRRGFVSTESASPADSAAGCRVFCGGGVSAAAKTKAPRKCGARWDWHVDAGPPSTPFLCCQPACRLETTGFYVGLRRARSQSTLLFCCSRERVSIACRQDVTA